MDAAHTVEPPERETHPTFETAAEHATARVPVTLLAVHLLTGRFQNVEGAHAIVTGSSSGIVERP